MLFLCPRTPYFTQTKSQSFYSGQKPYMICHLPLPLPSLTSFHTLPSTGSAPAILASLLFTEQTRNLLTWDLCSSGSLCMECFSPKQPYLTPSPPARCSSFNLTMRLLHLPPCLKLLLTSFYHYPKFSTHNSSHPFLLLYFFHSTNLSTYYVYYLLPVSPSRL